MDMSSAASESLRVDHDRHVDVEDVESSRISSCVWKYVAALAFMVSAWFGVLSPNSALRGGSNPAEPTAPGNVAHAALPAGEAIAVHGNLGSELE